jgi:hypothetical protein
MTGVLDRLIRVEPGDLDLWCRIHLGAGLQEELFRDGHLSRVIGDRLTSGQQVVVKVRQRSSRLVACSTAHRVLFERGFPCPEPLVDLEPLGEGVASAEAMIVGGEPFPDSGRSPEPFAKALAHLIALAPAAEELGSLDPAPPWTAATNEASDLWPWPDDLEVDLNTVDGPAWIEQGARVARDRLQSCAQQVTIGHGDWYTANLRWAERDMLAVFDWDSVIATPEPVIVGLAAAVYPTTEAGTEESMLRCQEAVRYRRQSLLTVGERVIGETEACRFQQDPVGLIGRVARSGDGAPGLRLYRIALKGDPVGTGDRSDRGARGYSDAPDRDLAESSLIRVAGSGTRPGRLGQSPRV